MVSLCCLSYSGTHSVGQADLKFRDSPVTSKFISLTLSYAFGTVHKELLGSLESKKLSLISVFIRTWVIMLLSSFGRKQKILSSMVEGFSNLLLHDLMAYLLNTMQQT